MGMWIGSGLSSLELVCADSSWMVASCWVDESTADSGAVMVAIQLGQGPVTPAIEAGTCSLELQLWQRNLITDESCMRKNTTVLHHTNVLVGRVNLTWPWRMMYRGNNLLFR